MLGWLRNLLDFSPVRLAIVRRYDDVNGAFIGELYRDGTMIGVSLDTMPVNVVANDCRLRWHLDTRNDFLEPIGLNTIRVGALHPQDNNAVRRQIGRLWQRRIRLTVQNRFFTEIKRKEI